MRSVIAPPQKKLKGAKEMLLLGAKGSAGGGMSVAVWVKPTIDIIEIGGTQVFLLSLVESSNANGFVRYCPPPFV